MEISDVSQTARYEATRGPHLTYRGGKILKKPSFYSIYLGDYWSTKKGTAERAANDKAAKSIVSGPYTDLWKEYGSGPGKFTGSTIMSDKKLGRSIHDSYFKDGIPDLVKNLSIPKPDGETVYTFFLPPGAILFAPSDDANSLNGLGGYHSSVDVGSKRAYYAAIVYSKGTNGIEFTGKPLDNISIAASHEWTEAVTDPDVNNGKLGWYDDLYGEVADIPITMGMPIKEVYEKVGSYSVQKEWSNKSGVI